MILLKKIFDFKLCDQRKKFQNIYIDKRYDAEFKKKMRMSSIKRLPLFIWKIFFWTYIILENNFLNNINIFCLKFYRNVKLYSKKKFPKKHVNKVLKKLKIFSKYFLVKNFIILSMPSLQISQGP